MEKLVEVIYKMGVVAQLYEEVVTKPTEVEDRSVAIVIKLVEVEIKVVIWPNVMFF